MPEKPSLDPGETVLEEFVGPVARLTITDQRIILSRLGHTTFTYEEVDSVNGGWFAGGGPAWRESNTILYGIYISSSDGREESAHIPRGKHAAALIESRSAPLRPPRPLWMDDDD